MLEHTTETLLALLQTGTGSTTGGEAVDEVRHALQTGTVMPAAGADDRPIVARVLADR